MEKNKRVLLAFGAALGLLLGLCYLMKLEGLRDEMARGRERVMVVTISRPLGIGDRLEEGGVAIVPWPREGLPRRAVLAEDVGLLLGRALIHPLPAGEPVLWTDLPEGPRAQLSSERIPPGLRAIALPAEEIRTLSHLLAPGDRVDVVWTRPMENSSRLVSTVLGEGVPVLAMGGRLSGDSGAENRQDTPSSITLVARPELALAICQAMQGGEVFLLARNREDEDALSLREISSPIEGVRGGIR
jgi:pilus assembly protein CpaB